MIFVIPYAFQSIIVQFKNVEELDEQNKQRQINATLERQAEIERNKTLEAEMASGSTPDDSDSIPEPSRLLVCLKIFITKLNGTIISRC